MTFRIRQGWFVVALAVMLCLTATCCNSSPPTPNPTATLSAAVGVETHPTKKLETPPTATMVPATPTPSPAPAPLLTQDGLPYLSLGCPGGNGYSPIAVAEDADLKRIYVYNSYNDEDGQDTLSVVSADTLEVIDTVRLGGNQTVPSLTSQLLVDSVTHRVYALNGDSRALLILDGDTLDILFIVHGATRVALAPTSSRVYLINQVGQIKSLSASDYSSLGSLDWEANFEPSNMAYNPVNDSLYLSRWDFSQRGTLVVLDGATLAQRHQIELSSAPYDLQVDAQNNMIYAATDAGIAIVDGDTDTIAYTLNLGIANFNPSRSMTLDSEKNRLYLSHNWGIALASGGELIIVDTETRSVISRVRTSHYWRDLAFSSHRGMLYAVPTQNESLLLVGTDGQILNRVMLGLQLLDIQPDPRSGQLWTVDSGGSIYVLSHPPDMQIMEKRTDVIGTLDGATEKAELSVAESGVYVTDRVRGRSVSLANESLETRQRFPAAGPLAVDESGQRLFVVAGNVHVYGLGTGKPLQEIVLPVAGDESPTAVEILYEPINDGVYLKMRSGIDSSVNYRTLWRVHNGKSGKYITTFNPDKRDVIGIAIASEVNRLYLSYSGASEWDKGLITYDLGGVELDRLRGLDGQLALSEDNQYLYVLRPSGLWALDRATMDQVALWPLSETYAQMVVDRDNQWLYLRDGPKVAALSVEELLRRGTQLPQKLPESVGLPTTTFRSPQYETDGLVYALVPGEGIYISSDRGQTWHLSSRGLKDLFVTELTFSDDFATDGVIRVKTTTGVVYRSNDRGKTWQKATAWAPTVAFASARGGSSAIYLIDGDGSQARRVTEEGIDAQNPHWAPEDNRICFDSNHEGNAEIYMIQPDGYGLARLTSDAAEDTDPAWSPVGDRIAFVSTRDGNSEIYLMEADGANPVRLTDNPATDRQPAWSPDGTRLALTSDRDGPDGIYILAWETGEIARLNVGDGRHTQPAWSPDGQWIAFVSDRHGDPDIFRVRPDGTELTQVTNASATEQSPAWAPDSRTLVVASDRTGAFQLYEMNLHGRNWRRLTMDAYANTAPPGCINRAGTLFPLTASSRCGYNRFMKPRIHHSIRDQAHVLLWASSALLFVGFLILGWPVSVNADPFDSGQFLASAGDACATQSSHTETIGSVYAGVQATEAITIYLPFISKPQFDPCERILGESYTAISVLPPVTDRPAEIHADLNLSIRGYRTTTGYLGLIDLQGPTDPLAPQLPGLFKDARTPIFASLYQVYDWDWGCNCRGAPITNPAVTLAGFAVAPGETIHVPSSGYTIGSELSVPSQGVTIGSGYEVLVLYASTERITLKYTREDNVVNGYTLHVENICVEPRLLALYQDWNSKGRRYLPALQAGQGFGRARDSEVRVAIRDNGSFMETRSRKDWWQGR